MTPGNNTQQMQNKETAPMTDNKTSFEAHSLGLTASTTQFQQQQQFNHSYNNATAMQFGEQQPIYATKHNALYAAGAYVFKYLTASVWTTAIPVTTAAVVQ